MDGGVPAARHADEIALDTPRRATGKRDDVDRAHVSPAVRARNRGARHDAHAGFPRFARQLAVDSRIRPRIDDRGDVDARARQRQRRAVRAVVVGENQRTRPRTHRVALDIATRRAGEQRAGQIVVGVGDCPLVGARREDDEFGANFPQALAWGCIGMLCRRPGDTLAQSDEVAVVTAECRGARQQRDLRALGERCRRGADPRCRGRIADERVRAEKAPAERGVLVADDHARPRMCRGARRGKSRWARADDEHVAVRVLMLVVIRIGCARGAAHPGSAADHVLVAHPGLRRCRPHERLVVEACRNEPRRHVVDGTDVEAKRRPAVLARRDQSVVERLDRRAHVGLGARAFADLQQRARLLDARGVDAARPVVLEAAGDKMDAVREKRRGDGVARVALVRRAVVDKPQRPRPIDDSAIRQSMRLRHRAGSCKASSMRALARISCVSVSRRTWNHCRHPALWSHNSSCGPAGLSRT